jgi:hypothetical protein
MRLHGIVQCVGDGATEDGVGLVVKGLQGTGHQIDGHLAGHVQILVENELHFLVFLSISLHKAGTGMDAHTAAATDGKLGIHRVAGSGSFLQLFVGKQPQILGLDQLTPGRCAQLQRVAGNEVQIPQTDPLKVGGLVNADEGNQDKEKIEARMANMYKTKSGTALLKSMYSKILEG